MNRTGRGKEITVYINGLTVTCMFFVHIVMSILVLENRICYLKKFTAKIGKNFISV